MMLNDATYRGESETGAAICITTHCKSSLEFSPRRTEVKAVTSADEALNAFSGFEPDVILSDIGMPGQDGYELIRRIENCLGNSMPAAAITALARSEDRMRTLNAGFQTHVSKPVAPLNWWWGEVLRPLKERFGRVRNGSLEKVCDSPGPGPGWIDRVV